MISVPKIISHYGTCYCCQKKHIQIVHFGYDTQSKNSYCICEKCFKQHFFDCANLDLANQWGINKMEEITKKEKIKFGNLSLGLKIPIIVSWILGILYIIIFSFAFLVSLTKV